MKRITLLIIGLLLALPLYPHPWKPSHYVIVDTDGGVDDMKTLCMLLASHDVRVLAVTVSPGVLSSDQAYIKTRSMLNSFYHEGLPVGINRSARHKAAEYPCALKTVWGNESNIDPDEAPDCYDVINEMLRAEKTKISFISLGSLSTAYDAYTRLTVFREQVREIIWSTEGNDNPAGFNYAADRSSAEKMLKQTDIPVNIVTGSGGAGSEFYDSGFIASIGTINTPYAQKVHLFFDSEASGENSFSRQATDEMIAVYLHYPELFNKKSNGTVSTFIPSDAALIKQSILIILKGETVARHQVIKEVPEDPQFYTEDIQPYVKSIIEKHGHDEWTSCIITNELHRHLGVFATIGVKMGIRAREYFNTGVDEFHVLSFAGSVPPLSCMNDGLQVSTGATPGHGLFGVSDNPVRKAAAEFTYLNRKIKVSLRPEIEEKISSELKEINFIYGLDSNIYWELVRQNSIKYWLDMDRHEIFLIEVLQ